MIKDNILYNKGVRPNTAFSEELRKLLPAFYVGYEEDENGNVINKGYFDTQKFLDALREQNVDEIKNGYHLDFVGKNYAKRQAGEQSLTVITPDKNHNEVIENKKSKNLLFSGDNLDVLRHLQNYYENSIDIIYIDPPYNTGSDGFIYPDEFEYTDVQLQTMFNLTEGELARLKSIQGKATHSAWLTFMYPRLYLAKKLLKDTGVIFVSIDDHEDGNLRLLMDEIFGEDGFLSQIIWERAYSPVNLKKHFSTSHDYILCYAKNINLAVCNGLPRSEEANDRYSNPDNDSRGVWQSSDLSVGPANEANIYEIITPSGRVVLPPSGYSWRLDEKTFEKYVVDNRIWFGKDGNGVPRIKRFLSEVKEGITPMTIWKHSEVGHSQDATKYLKDLFDGKAYFDYPKPVPLIKRCLELYGDSNSVIMDFFAGSGTTAEAVMQLNTEDKGNRQYILVQFPEKIKESSVAYKDGYQTIDEITQARLDKTKSKIIDGGGATAVGCLDLGYQHYYVMPPKDNLIEKIEFESAGDKLFGDDMVTPFSSKALGIKGDATGWDTILRTYLVKDGYKFDVEIEYKNFGSVKVPYVNKQRLYLLTEEWNTLETKALVNQLGCNKIAVQSIVIYGHTLAGETFRELEVALKQLDCSINLITRY